MTMTIERRLSPRYDAVTNIAVVQFEQEGRPQRVDAHLTNISRSGALLRLRDKVRLKSLIHIRLEYPVKTQWILAVAVRRTRTGEIGLAFVRGCDPTFFWTATRGEDFHRVG